MTGNLLQADAVRPFGDEAGRRIVIGVDEAGYGPNLGPLVIAASAWSIPATMSEEEFTRTLAEDFRPSPWRKHGTHVPLGDSKKLYQPSTGLQSLELGLLALAGQLGWKEPTLGGWLQRLCGTNGDFSCEPTSGDAHGLMRLPWYAPLDVPVPGSALAEDVARLVEWAGERLRLREMRLVALRARIVTEREFNQAVSRLGSKGTLLSKATLNLVTELTSQFAQSDLEVFCDRQGGRKKYSGVLVDAMPDDWFDVLQERDARSSYRRLRSPAFRIHFSVGGDSFPPTALASMAAKYVRERLMELLNGYWRSVVPTVQPTAGYPVDAKRFRAQIEARARELGHQPEDWWRTC
jgi:ribonuclease HII